jgi:hypothetical protein
MSKKHFQLFAEAIALIDDYEERKRTAIKIAEVCAKANTRFNYSLFLNACGVEQ